MYIKKVKLENYRNYDLSEIEFDKNINIILGENAQGKTNLLDSLYISSFGKSFRTSNSNEIVNFEKDYCKIRTYFNKFDEDEEIEIYIDKKSKRAFKLNGVNLKKYTQVIDNILTVIFSPEDLKIIKEEPEKRRKFIDKEISQLKISYLDNLIKYKKVLSQRNAFLKNIKENKKTEIKEVFDIQLVNYGSQIIYERINFIKKLEKISNELHNKLTGKNESLQIKYLSDIPLNNLSTEENDKEINIEKIKGSYKKEIEKNKNRDFLYKTTSKGPHRDDIKVEINGIDARKYGSQGQQRTAALSLKLSEIIILKEEKNESPILLLDDVFSELDISRQSFLVETLKDIQIFITTTEISNEILEKLSDIKVLKIKKGNLI